MAAKRSYSRYFIILQEDEKGYSTDPSKFPTGYAKVERKNDKCKVSYYVQNLKRSKDSYYMVLICDRKNDKRLLNLGAINVDNYGRAELSCEYEVNNVANSNIPIETIKGASIVRIDGSNIHGVLTGFVNGAKLEDWKSYAVIENKERVSTEKLPEKKVEEKVKVEEESKEELKAEKVVEEDNINREENIFDEYENNIEAAKNIEIENNMDNNLSDNIENSIENKQREEAEVEVEAEVRTEAKDEEQVEENVETKAEEKVEEEKVLERSQVEESKPYTEHKVEEDENYPIGNEGNYFRSLAKGLEEVKDVCSEIGKCRWYRVSSREFINANPSSDFNKYTTLYYPMTNYYPYFKRHGHYLVGYKCDAKGNMRYLVYGIPGARCIQDQPFGGATGFVTWTRAEKGETRDDTNGYWLMFYDYKNSMVVAPVKRR